MFFWILLGLTAVIWLLLAFWPMAPARGDYDFGWAVYSFLRLVVGVIATLLVWLFYLAVTGSC